MTVPTPLLAYVGNWTATHRLWLSPDEPVRESQATASLTLVAQGQALLLRYTWFEDTPQDGVLVFNHGPASTRVTAFWLDSWHMANQHMFCQGEANAAGSVSVKGTYPAPPGPDWGWRIVVEPQTSHTWRLVMFNISPGGQEDLAIQADFVRSA